MMTTFIWFIEPYNLGVTRYYSRVDGVTIRGNDIVREIYFNLSEWKDFYNLALEGFRTSNCEYWKDYRGDYSYRKDYRGDYSYRKELKIEKRRLRVKKVTII